MGKFLILEEEVEYWIAEMWLDVANFFMLQLF